MTIVVCLRPAVNEADRRRCNDPALALALALGAAGHRTIALLPDSVGHVEPLQLALAAGAARAVRLIDDQMSTTDFHGLGQLLAKAVRVLDGDIVMMGFPFDDEGVGAMSAALAKNLGAVHVSRVEAMSAGARPDTVEVTVRGGGRKRRLAVKGPAVLSVVAPPDADVALPEASPPPAAPDAAIETLALSDPDVTVVRRRSEHLGRPVIASRDPATVHSAAELVARLRGQ
jgi:electron transfer flavoprotein beta subunit